MRMKRTVRLFCILAVMMLVGSQLAVSVFAGTDSKWKTPVVELEKTSDGITVDIQKEAKGKYYYISQVTYTIPENFEGNIVINAMDDINKAMDGKTYVPGDAAACVIKVENKSAHDYTYKKDSFVVSTESYQKYFDKGSATKSGISGFDGQDIPNEYLALRTSTKALQALYGDASKKLTAKQLQDDALDQKLKEHKYTGLSDLGKYCLDYYNKAYFGEETSKYVSKLEDFSNGQISDIVGGTVIGYDIYETNPELAALAYDYFYNHLITITPESVGYTTTDENTVGSYMAGYHKKNASAYESICNRDFGDIKAGSEAALEGFVMNLNGPDTKNVYQSYNFGFTLGFQLEQTDVEQYYYDGAVSVTKNVTENGQPYQVNTTFYAALFNDEACTELTKDAGGQPIILPLELKGEDSVTITTDKTIPRGTFYVAETDQYGNVVKSSEGHTVSISSPTIAVTDEAAAEVTITNDYNNFEGYYKENDGNPVTTTSEVITTTTEDEENSEASVQTGDDTNMALYAALLILAAAAAGGTIAAGRRKKNVKK